MDTRIWHYSKNGVYTVRSAYRVAMEYLFNYNDFKVTGDWCRIWDLKVPPKVKVFLWRAGRNVLPNRVNLQAKVVPVPLSCVVCNGEIENSWHTFVNRPFARQCWRLSRLSHIVNTAADNSDGFVDWLFKVLHAVKDRELCSFAMTLWGIWRERNERLWNNKMRLPDQVVFSANEALYDWIQANVTIEADRNRLINNRVCNRWHEPPVSYLKCNCDAATFYENGEVGMGMILRDELGNMIACRMLKSAGLPEVKECEALTLQQAMSWVCSMGYVRVIFEVNSKVVVDALGSNLENYTEFGSIIGSCRRILDQFNDYKVVFAMRN
ncbi:hypothetical protein DITRI_Ditri10aG0094800 [Diplodiscus trichospermus]